MTNGDNYGGRFRIGKRAWNFAAEGAVVVGVEDVKNLQLVLEKVKASGGQGSIIPADLSDYDLAKGVVEKTVQDHGGVDILVHSASVGWVGVMRVRLYE